MAEIGRVLTHPREADRLVVDVADMRRRIADQHRRPPIWEVKHRRGGLIDLEFIAQFLQLRWAHQCPEVLRQNTGVALAALARAGVLDAGAAEELDRALTLWRNVQGLLKLTVEDPFDESGAPPALRAILARGAGAIDFERMKLDMSAVAAEVRARYSALVARPATRARRRLGILEPTAAHMTEEETT